MSAILPDFTPRDSHSLWYQSSRNPVPSPGHLEASHPDGSLNHGPNASRNRGHMVDRSTLTRLLADEQNMQRRRLNVQNFGSGWLRPPGVPKTLHQLLEEKREQEEHQEALRREQLVQELAEAGGLAEDGNMDDIQLDGTQDLDDMIPEADDDFARDDDDDDEEEEEEDADNSAGEEAQDEDALREIRQNDLMAARMRAADDAFREALVRGDPDGGDMYGGDEELEEEDQGHMLDEDDFAHDQGVMGGDMDGGDMDADLDDDIPEAESGGYEHTDSEAELSSSEEDDDEGDRSRVIDHGIGFAPRAEPILPPQSPTLRGARSSRGGDPRVSMDLSNLLSQDESSFMDSSPVPGRHARHG